MTSSVDPPVDPPQPCTECGGKLETIGATPAGALAACMKCGWERIVPDDEAVAEAARRDAQVAAEGAEHVSPILIGPYSRGELHRLRHPDQVAALDMAARQGPTSMELVVVWLRGQGFELTRTAKAFCTCVYHGPTVEDPAGGLTRSPVCELHGDVVS